MLKRDNIGGTICISLRPLQILGTSPLVPPPWFTPVNKCCQKCKLTCQYISPSLTASTLSVPNCCCSKGPAPYWSNPPWTERQIARMSKIKTGGLDQYMANCKATTWLAVKGLMTSRCVCMCVGDWQSLFLQSRIKSSQLLTSYLHELNTLLDDKRNTLRLARHSKHLSSLLVLINVLSSAQWLVHRRS